MSGRAPARWAYVAGQLRAATRDPRRLRKLTQRAALARFARLLVRMPAVPRWEAGPGGLQTRAFGSYEEYLRVQRSKLALLDLREYDRRFHDVLRARLEDDGRDGAWRGRSVLCLGARLGTEVRVFRDLGAFAVGVDLEPGPGNRHVVVGDFHDLQFADRSVDAVYTNSLDHALDLPRVLAEVRRVLKPGGVAIVEAGLGDAESPLAFGAWEATSWATVDQLVALMEAHGLRLEGRTRFDEPWPGAHLRLRIARR